MITIRRSDERGRFDHGWLDARHTFSFGGYDDPSWRGFGHLRVINEDVVAPGQGFGMHGHRDMEIVTYVLSGRLEHRDSLGNRGVIGPGEIQRMTAGSGIRHAEYNPSADEPVHLLQIWILPRRSGATPAYAQRVVRSAGERGLRVIASGDGREGSLTIEQDAVVHAGVLDRGMSASVPLGGRRAWVQLARGSASVNGRVLSAGDGAGLEGEASLALSASEDGTEVLVFEV
ncbi:MAG: pirin family protein [Phycisphaerales bacterium]|nr:pirin family protein [Phycisphaerales bacterium]